MPINSKPDLAEPLIDSNGRATRALDAYLQDLQNIVNALERGGVNLQTTDPGVSGTIWNDAGTVKVSP